MVACGHVYCLNLPLAGKDKLLVPAYISADDKVRFFVINTERTEFQIDNPRIVDHIIPVPQNVNQQFLKYDSWIVCNEVIGGWTGVDIDATKGCYRGALDAGTAAIIRKTIIDSRLYSDAEKSLILGQWPQ